MKNQTRFDKLDILRRLVSKRHFNKIKILFNVNTDAEMKKLMNEFNEETNKYIRHDNCWNCVPNLKWHINPDDICTMAQKELNNYCVNKNMVGELHTDYTQEKISKIKEGLKPSLYNGGR